MLSEEFLSCILERLVIIVLVIRGLEVIKSLAVLALSKSSLAETCICECITAVSLDYLFPLGLSVNVAALIVKSK